MDWTKADAHCINSYQTVLDEALSSVDIPVNLLHENDIKSISQMNRYYSEIVTCITNACQMTIPSLSGELLLVTTV